jgi:hypothetical protein
MMNKIFGLPGWAVFRFTDSDFGLKRPKRPPQRQIAVKIFYDSSFFYPASFTLLWYMTSNDFCIPASFSRQPSFWNRSYNRAKAAWRKRTPWFLNNPGDYFLSSSHPFS